MKDAPRRLYSLANYFWFAAGTGLMLAMPLAIAVVLNRAGSPEDVGLYALAYAVTAPMQAFLGIHARTFIAIDRLHGHSVVDVVAQRFHMTVGLFLGVALVLAARGFAPVESAVLAAMCLVRAAEGLAEVSAGIVQRRHRPELIAAVYGLRAVAGIAAFALFYQKVGLPLALAAMAGTSLAVFLIFDRRIVRLAGTALPWSGIFASAISWRPLTLSRRLLPAGVVILLSVGETNLPRYVVENRVGLVELGAFTSLSFVLYAATNLVVPVYQMTIARLGQCAARANAEDARDATRIVLVNLLLSGSSGAALVLVVALAGAPAMIWVFGPQYAHHEPLLMALAAGAAIGMIRSCLGFLLTALDAIRALSAMSAGNMALFGLLIYAGVGAGSVAGIGWAWATASAATALAGLVILACRLSRLRRSGIIAGGIQRV